MDNKKIRIVAAVVDTTQLTLYKEDGETIFIPQGDPRLRRILEQATPGLLSVQYADIDLEEIISKDNSYADFEKQQTSGVVKFFRIAKDKLKKLFQLAEPVAEQVIGEVPKVVNPADDVFVQHKALMDQVLSSPPDIGSVGTSYGFDGDAVPSATPASDHIATAGIHDVSELDEVAAAMEQVEQPKSPEVAKTMSVIDEIMQHAIPVQSENFTEENVAKQANVVEQGGNTPGKEVPDNSTHTIIAVVDSKVIAGVEKIKTQFGRAAKLGSTIGVEKFLQRIASVVDKRRHSAEDLLKFMERGDLPIADDGSILIYKVLRRSPTSKHYVDCHTGKVQQWVGAYVCMDEKLVDHNRNTECSNGLHVARRGYIGSFSGDVCVLAKLAPEDVIAVPIYDANKMRVCGYHIIAELTDAQFSALKGNQPLTQKEDGKILLYKAIAGDHIGKTHEVRVTGQQGHGVVVTQLTRPEDVAAYVAPVPVKKTEPEHVPETPPEVVNETTDEDEVEEEFAEAEELLQPTPIPVIRKAEALGNPEDENKAEILDPKTVIAQVEQVGRKAQAAKLYAAWDNAPQSEVQQRLAELLTFKKEAKVSWDRLGIADPLATPTTKPTAPAVKLKGKAKVKAKAKARTEAKAGGQAVNAGKPEPVIIDRGRVIAPLPAPSEGSPRERIAKLISLGLEVSVAAKIYEIKKKAKKSWGDLGVSVADEKKIVALIGK